MAQAELIISCLGIIFAFIAFYWRQHNKIKSLEKKLQDIDSEEVSNTGNLVFDEILPNVDAVKAKILKLIDESKTSHKPLRIDNFGLDLETIGSMFRYTFIKKITKRDVIYRGLIIDPDSKNIEKVCVGKSNLSQNVASNVISQVKKMIRTGESESSIQITSYDQPPVIHGFLIDEEHLLLSFTAFYGKGLIGGSSPYIYIKKDVTSEFKESFFKTYCSWFEFWWENGTQKVMPEQMDDSYLEEEEMSKLSNV